MNADRHSLHFAKAPLRRKLLAALVAACYGVGHGAAQAGPVNPTVVAGQASITQQGKTYTIANTPNTVINWQGFSLGADEVARFVQQSADSKVLNRITGQDPSVILGSLQSNGKVFLINPNGVLFGAGSRVDVQGLVASSLALSNADFLAGQNKFTDGAGAGKVENQGRIATPSGGQIFLVAPNVENSGVISAPNGQVVLAAGHSVQLFDARDPNVQVVVSAPADQALNLGSIVAEGGRIGVYGALVSQRGAINADSAVRGANGQIVLKASRSTALDASSSTSARGLDAAQGGEIQLLGQQVALSGNAVVDASGAAGGGVVLVGGDYQGKNAAVLNAQQTYVGQDSVIRADATASGDGGKVIVWGDRSSQVYGAISARGGVAGGNGGLVETSGHYLDMQGTVDTRARSAGGKTGTLLLDPSDIYLAANTSIATAAGMLGANTLINGGGLFIDTQHIVDSLLLTSVLQNALNNTDVTVSTANSSGNGAGNIHVLSPLQWTGASTLTLRADHDILLKSAVTGVNGALNLNAGGAIVQTTSPINALALGSLSAMAAGDITLNNSANAISGQVSLNSIGGNAALTAANIRLGSSNVSSLALTASDGNIALEQPLTISQDLTLSATGNVSAQALTVGGVFRLNSGNWRQEGTLPSFYARDFRLNGGSFVRALSGDGSASLPYVLADVYGLQGVDTLAVGTSFNLGNDIDASGSARWNSALGFKPLGSTGGGFGGVFDGGNHLVSGLAINRPGETGVGLFAALGNGSIRNLSVSGTVRGAVNVGGVVGTASIGTVIDNVRSAVDVSGVTKVGGLVGENGAAITGSGASGAVNASGAIAGGLVGDNAGGAISVSYAGGNVRGGASVGGLAGRNRDTGSIAGTISNAYASGNVSANLADNTVTHSDMGGLIGELQGGSVSNVYSSGQVDQTGFTAAYGMVGAYTGGSLLNGYFNADSAGTSIDTVGTALSGAQTMQQSSFGGFSFAGSPVWRIYEGHTAPMLKAFLTPYTVSLSGGLDVTKTYDGASVAYTGHSAALPSGINGTLGFDGAVNAGTYQVGGLYSTQYDIHYTGAVAALTILPRVVSATVSANKVYDGADYLEAGVNFSFANLVGSDTLGIRGTVRFADKNVGNGKVLSVADPSLTGNDFGNYVLSGAVTGSGNITPATLWLDGLSINNRSYNGTAVATFSGTAAVQGISGDDVALGSLGSDALSFADKNVGNGKLVTLNQAAVHLSGADAGNYVVAAPADLSANITPALLSVTGLGAASRVYNLDADAVSATHGRLASVGGGVLQGVIGSEQVNIAGAHALFADKNIGTGKPVTVDSITLGGLDAANYALASLPSGLTANITPVTLNVSLPTREYNNSAQVNLAAATLSGVLALPGGAADNVALATTGLSAAYADKNVGIGKLVSITGGTLGLSGSDAGNYVLAPQPLSGTLSGTITQRALSTWVGTGSGVWSDAANWQDGVAPSGANVLAANLGNGSGVVTYDSAAGATTLATLNASGRGLTLSGGSLTLNGGANVSSVGALILDGGALTFHDRFNASSLVLGSGTLAGRGAATRLNLGSLQQNGGVIDLDGALSVDSTGDIVLGNVRAANGVTLTTLQGAVSQNGSLVTDQLQVQASNGITLTNASNHVQAFTAANTGSGNIVLHNDAGSGELALGVLNGNGNIVIDNIGGVHTTGAISGANLVSLTAHSPITVNHAISGDDIVLDASTGITLGSGASLNARHAIDLTAGSGIALGGVLSVPSSGAISALARTGNITAASGTQINAGGAPVTLTTLVGSVTVPAGVFNGVGSATIQDGAAAAAAAAQAAAEAAAAQAAAEAAAKAAAEAAAKAAAEAAAKAAAEAAAKAAAEATAKAAAEA
ncbi:MAG: YDG domain-containing protein, partial [Duganella sp.]